MLTDCILTSSEIVQIMEQSDLLVKRHYHVHSGGLKEKVRHRHHDGASSSRYLAHIFRHMAKQLFNEDVTCHTLKNKTSRRSPLKRMGRFCYALLLCTAFKTSRMWF